MYEKELLRMVSSSSKMLDHLLVWAKEQVAGHDVAMQNIDIAEYMSETIELSEVSAERKGVTLEVIKESNDAVYCDPDLTTVIVRNLVQNAIKFSDPSSTVKLSFKANKEDYTISVADEGVGMSDDQLENLFKPKGNKDSFGTHNEKGVGLGMLLVKRFSDLQGAKIVANSEQGQGTKVAIRIPINRVG